MSQDRRGRVLITTICASVSVVAIYFIASFLAKSLFNREMTDASAIFLSLIPFVVYLVVSGKISELSGGGFTIKFNKASESPVISEEVVYVDPEVIEKASSQMLRERLPKIAVNPPTTLRLDRELAKRYTDVDLKTYLEELTKFDVFKYVLFVDEGDVFKGYLYARSLLGQFSDVYRRKEIIEAIHNWNLGEIQGFKEHCIKSYQSNKEALRIMEKEKISEIAVVDEDKRFKGFTNQQIITSKILNNLMIKG